MLIGCTGQAIRPAPPRLPDQPPDAEVDRVRPHDAALKIGLLVC
jgi:hypothetical protein